MVGAGLDFGQRWAVRSGRRWAGLRSALGSEEWSALSFGATDWLDFGRRWAVRSGRRWAGLQSALGSEEWSALSFGATD